jgi:hypothetical protein
VRRGNGLGLGRILLPRWCENGVQNGAFHARHEFHNASVTDVLNEPVDDVVAEITMGHLTATETQARLDLVALSEEADSLVLLGLVVVLVDSYAELDFFNCDDFLLLTGGSLALFLFVEIAAVVLNAAHRWDGVGRDLDEVKAALPGNL